MLLLNKILALRIYLFVFCLSFVCSNSSFSMIDAGSDVAVNSGIYDHDEEKKIESKLTVQSKKSKRKLRRENKLNGNKWSKY